MRHSARVTSLSWIPTEAVPGINKTAFTVGFTHYDEPPPDHIDDIGALRDADRFRFANSLDAWIEVRGGHIIDAGYSGGIVMGSTSVRLAGHESNFAAVAFPDIQHEPEIRDGSARFVQSVGGHTALPLPRHVSRPPFVKYEAPTVWTTLALTIGIDGSAEHELVGASPFPRHWIYDHDGALVAKVGVADFKDWIRNAFGSRTPWGDVDTPALVTTAETALERELAGIIMRSGEKPGIRKVKMGSELTRQGEPGGELFLLLDGVLAVEVDGEVLAEVGPGAILGERAVLEGGRRTGTVRALTKARVAVVRGDQIDQSKLAEVSSAHRREESAMPRGVTAGSIDIP